MTSTQKRQVVLDTETTGISIADDHRIIEIGGVEMINRRLTGNNFHYYINPQREVEAGAFEVHGISNEFLADKPLFEDIADDFLRYIEGAELVIHNAPFDVGFLDHELSKLAGETRRINSICSVLDTLEMARAKHRGQKNNLDALCKRYDIDNTSRELHGALLDAEILADVYLAMTGGQVSLGLMPEELDDDTGIEHEREQGQGLLTKGTLTVLRADDEELAAHQAMLEQVNKASGGQCVWLASEEK